MMKKITDPDIAEVLSLDVSVDLDVIGFTDPNEQRKFVSDESRRYGVKIRFGKPQSGGPGGTMYVDGKLDNLLRFAKWNYWDDDGIGIGAALDFRQKPDPVKFAKFVDWMGESYPEFKEGILDENWNGLDDLYKQGSM